MKKFFLEKYYHLRWRLWDLKHTWFKAMHSKLFKNPENYIPNNSCYCYTRGFETSITPCPFWRKVPFFPEQHNGYCHYLNKTDIELNIKHSKNSKIAYSQNKEDEGKTVIDIYGIHFPTSLLWDQVKECGINEENSTKV